MENNQEMSMIDYIIKKWFPVIGVLFIVGGISYLFYDGIWQNISEAGRLVLGFILGVVFIAGGYSFDKKLKGFADVLIGGGILIIYLTLIFGSRFESTESALIPEMAALLVALVFSGAVAYYSYVRKSKYILALGALGGYLTPFFIGKAGEFSNYLNYGESFQYHVSLPMFLIYFGAISVAIFLVANKMFLKGIGVLNTLGLFLGTFSLVQIRGEEFSENTVFLSIYALVVIIFHIAAMAVNAKKFEKETDPFLIGGYILPLFWFIVFVNSFIKPDFSDTVVASLFALVAGAYFFAWYYLRNITNSDRHFSLYTGGIFALILALLNLVPTMREYSGLLLSFISVIFIILYYLKPLVHREVSALLFAVGGVGLNLLELHNIDFSGFAKISGESVFIILTLTPFVLLAPTTGLIKTKGEFFPIKKFFGYISYLAILFLLVNDIFGLENIPLSFLFLTIPAMIMVIVAIQEEDYKSKNKSFNSAAILAMLGFFGSFLTIIDRFYPAPEDLLPFSTSESLVGFSTLVLLYIIIKKYIEFDAGENGYQGTPFLLTFSFYLTLWSVITHEILGFFNVFGLDFTNNNIQGIRAFAVTLWWAGLALYMLLTSEQNKIRDKKNIGFALLAATILKLIFYDLANVNTNLKVFLFIALGAAIMFVSYNSQKKEKIINFKIK